MYMPADNAILLSAVNMKLRDGCESLEELCAETTGTGRRCARASLLWGIITTKPATLLPAKAEFAR